MGLTREQYNRIMAILDERRLASEEAQKRRIEEAMEKISPLRAVGSELQRINRAELNARFSGNAEAVESLKQERKDLFRARKELLKSAGFPEDYLEKKSFCPDCGDTGYLPDGEKCSCFRKLEAEQINEASCLPEFLRGIPFSELSTAFYDDSAPMRDMPRNPKQYTQRSYMEQLILPKIREYVEHFDRKTAHNMYLFGAAGTGKTYLTACVAESLMEKAYSVIYIRADDLFRLYEKETFGKEGSEAAEARLAVIENCDLLILDDLGTEFTTDLVKSRLFSLISHRLSQALSTIISSNMNLDELQIIFNERIASRIQGNYLTLPLFGTDLRLKKRSLLLAAMRAGEKDPKSSKE